MKDYFLSIVVFVSITAGFMLGVGLMLFEGKNIAVAKAVFNGEECVLPYPSAMDYFNSSLRDGDSYLGYSDPNQSFIP